MHSFDYDEPKNIPTPASPSTNDSKQTVGDCCVAMHLVGNHGSTKRETKVHPRYRHMA